MNVDLGIWSKLTRAILFLVFAAAVVGVIVWYLPVIRHNENIRQTIHALDEQIQREEASHRHLSAMIDAMQQDPETVERVAREKLGYSKPGETVILFETQR